jgi:hypothetical protein
VVVLCHHPLHWFADADATKKYLQSRARVFMSGHEHAPSLTVESIDTGCDVLMLSAGAAVPPKVEGVYTFSYNLIIFDWDRQSDGLIVRTIPRIWSDIKTAFEPDTTGLGEEEPTHNLGCPNFRAAAPAHQLTQTTEPSKPNEPSNDEETPLPLPVPDARLDVTMPDPFPLLLLRFFRLTPDRRLGVLTRLRLLPEGWPDPLSQAIERGLLDGLVKANRLSDLEGAIREIQDLNP